MKKQATGLKAAICWSLKIVFTHDHICELESLLRWLDLVESSSLVLKVGFGMQAVGLQVSYSSETGVYLQNQSKQVMKANDLNEDFYYTQTGKSSTEVSNSLLLSATTSICISTKSIDSGHPYIYRRT